MTTYTTRQDKDGITITRDAHDASILDAILTYRGNIRIVVGPGDDGRDCEAITLDRERASELRDWLNMALGS